MIPLCQIKTAMKLTRPSSLKLRLIIIKPCNKFLHLLKFKLRKQVFIKALHLRGRRPKLRPSMHCNCNPFSKIFSFLCSLGRRRGDTDRLADLRSFSDAGYLEAPAPSPLTPAYVRMGGRAARVEVIPEEEEEVEESCRRFENYVTEMILDGKLKDLAEVEELLYCWKSLKSPFYRELVCRFYRELCRDLFSNENQRAQQIVLVE